ncbi:probable LRR receptor-like serine/threonine-protein kinase At1g05700 isoform X1 [Arachis ipaensis]|uniref:probable LRR receptor-like serine/threonine-protein kinase At1g05700 isoform X1 n=1 Tax=Arachis ipaensis TaxID=130454 RepID=UPI000A2AFC89|nr:probable LRR receptor-like serine/threonine-protein kinase At1g05700 isoform X1 [Arachis ipaensis]
MATSLFLLLGALSFIATIQGQDQSGFISIDCGLPENYSYVEKNTGISYISDANFIDSGVSKIVSPQDKATHQQYFTYLRSFPYGTRNCYRINNVTINTEYLIRTSFLYGNYDGLNKLPQFEVHVGTNLWDTLKFSDASVSIYRELSHSPTRDYVDICLVNIGTGTPFISAIELRILEKNNGPSSSSVARLKGLDLGSKNNSTCRYRDDIYDCLWEPYSVNGWRQLISTNIDPNPTQKKADIDNIYVPPASVMRTAATPRNARDSLDFYFHLDYVAHIYHVRFYFAEVQKLSANESRSFNISVNGNYWEGPIVPTYNQTVFYDFFSTYFERVSEYRFSLLPTEFSTLPPITNAIEIFLFKDFSQPQTQNDQVDAMRNIKIAYKVSKNWQGDPCAPVAYKWDGLNCSSVGTLKITALNLSSSGLTGQIVYYIAKLTDLESLDLSNNSLNGEIPDFLADLPSLKVLNLHNNNLTGQVPNALIQRSSEGVLSLRLGQNPNLLCESALCDQQTKDKSKKNNRVIYILASISAILVLLLLVLATVNIIYIKKRKPKDYFKVHKEFSDQTGSQLESKRRRYSFNEVSNMTNNFERVLGRGGFGTVYYGIIDDIQVAVKMLSQSSVQGYQQFLAEVNILMRVHHRNLTSLIGYCNEETNIALIYEYMENGNLEEHLLEKNSRTKLFNWEERLTIAMDAAQGLEYLHNGCKPPIIHRDVKCTNILLNENFQAKMSDLGLSRSIPVDGGTHVTTVIAGTPGYLDPEYQVSNRLTEKSDVYSFGVVLLEIITGKPAILKAVEGKIHISEWVKSMLAKGDVKCIVDTRLQGDFESSSVWRAVEIAMASVSNKSSKRPYMTDIVTELKECLAMELARKLNSCETMTMNLATESESSSLASSIMMFFCCLSCVDFPIH